MNMWVPRPSRMGSPPIRRFQCARSLAGPENGRGVAPGAAPAARESNGRVALRLTEFFRAPLFVGARDRHVYARYETVKLEHIRREELFRLGVGDLAVIRDEAGRELYVRLDHVHERRVAEGE